MQWFIKNETGNSYLKIILERVLQNKKETKLLCPNQPESPEGKNGERAHIRQDNISRKQIPSIVGILTSPHSLQCDEEKKNSDFF